MLFVYPPDNQKSTVYYVMQHLKSLLPKVVVKVQQSVSTITHFLIVWFLALIDVCGDNAILREGMLAPIVNWHSAIHTVGMDTIVLLPSKQCPAHNSLILPVSVCLVIRKTFVIYTIVCMPEMLCISYTSGLV